MAYRDNSTIQNTLDSPEFQVPTKYSQLESRFQAAFLFSAIGDALGWPTEFLKDGLNEKLSFDLPIKDFVPWQKRVGGLWWGYKDTIQAGEYSDDTQLSLALARSISDSGRLQPEQFAYFELPLWLHYERGGGRSIKAAARSLIGPRSTWFRNFYQKPGLDYRSAGANGAAMRTLPIALANLNYEDHAIVDTFLNAIITHGHPNAILGAILFALATRYALISQNTDTREMLGYLKSSMERSLSVLLKDSKVRDWISYWERGLTQVQKFESLYLESLRRVIAYMDDIPKFLESPVEDYYHQVGALDARTKGSGIGTVSSALYLFLRNKENPQLAIETAVNVIGSDTDTISSFVGALFGAHNGLKDIPTSLAGKIQDREYILKIGREICAIASGMRSNKVSSHNPIQKRDAYLKMLAWEIGLHEMFWDAIEVGGSVVHPALGRGTITEKLDEPMAREGYSAKLLHVQFDVGQKCVFHSRVKGHVEISGSLGREIDKGLESTLQR